MASININGKRIQIGGSRVSNVTITNGGVYVNGRRVEDGEFVTGDERVFHILVEGDVDQVSNEAGNVNVDGNVTGSIKNVSGDVLVAGSVQGSVSTVSGDAKISGDVGGSVKTVSGDIRR